MTADIIDYLGKYEDGVIVLISLGWQNKFYEATFFYKEEFLALIPDPQLEEDLGCDIEDWSDYEDLMISIIEKVVPYDEIISRIDNFDPGRYGLYLDTGTQSTT